MVALVDANNMYVSCERVFAPRLVGRPVVVLSSNDGACIARSNEAKELGVKMAQPWFQVRHLERTAGLIAVSANFELYSDMSARMMAVAGRYAPRQQVYSIDECFLDFEGMRGELVQIGRQLRAAVLREVGLPTSIGFGATKTLAKLANHVGKTADRKPGSYSERLAQVCNFASLDAQELEAVFASTDVGTIWGVGRKISAKLREAGIRSVLDFVRADAAMIRSQFSVVLEKTLLELRGTPCLDMSDVDDSPAAKQQILVSRSFGKAITAPAAIMEAVSEFASRAAEKLRHQHSTASAVGVFFMTSPFRANDRPHSVNVTIPLVRPTADSGLLVRAAVDAAKTEFRHGFNYAKAGVVLSDLRPASQHQGELDLFAHDERNAPAKDRSALMDAMDVLNRRFGRDSVRLGSSTLASHDADVRSWATRQERRSPRYTTRWEEMPVVKS
ncbi:MAG: Y-family DNA polymerase [Burkholderiales bacterium]